MKRNTTLDVVFNQPKSYYIKSFLFGALLGLLNTYLLGPISGSLTTMTFMFGEVLRYPSQHLWDKLYKERVGEKPPNKKLFSSNSFAAATLLTATSMYLKPENYVELREALGQIIAHPISGLESALNFSETDRKVAGTFIYLSNTARSSYFGFRFLEDLAKSSPLKKLPCALYNKFMQKISRGEKKEKYFKKIIYSRNDLLSYYFFMADEQSIAKGISFSLKERFFSGKDMSVTNELLHRKIATVFDKSNKYSDFEAFLYNFVVGDTKLAETYFESSAEVAMKKNDTSQLTALCLFQDIEGKELSEDLWNNFSLQTDEKFEMTIFGEGSRGVETPADTNSPEHLLLLKKQGTLEDYILFDDQHKLMQNIRTTYKNDPSIRSPYSTAPRKSIKNNKSYMFLLRSRLPSFHDVLAENKNNSLDLLVDSYTKLKGVATSLLAQNEVKVNKFDFEKKYLGHNLLSDLGTVYDVSLAQEMVNILTEGSEKTSTFLLDNISKNLGYSIDERILEIRDLENKGRATEMLNIVNQLNHSFDVISYDDFKSALNILLLRFSNEYSMEMKETERLYCAALASRRDSFVRAWVKPHRTEEHTRIEPFLDHCTRVFSFYDTPFARGQASQSIMIKEGLDDITAKWATK